MLTSLARLAMAAIFIVFGFNGFLQFLPMPPLPERATGLVNGLMQAQYFFPLLKMTEISCGFLILLNFWVPLALVVLAPIVVQIFCFHIFLAPEGIPLALLIVVLQVFLSWSHRRQLSALFSAKHC